MSAGTMRVLVTGDGTPFLSTSTLSEEHSALLRSLRGAGDTEIAPGLLGTIASFIARAQATGALIDDIDDRRSIQTILDYWTTVLYRNGHEPPEAILADFDPQLAPKLAESLCPYRGLEAFREDDQHLFFGRRQLISELIDRLCDERLLAVIGRSGSGKSSLVMGGLIPALKGGALPGSHGWRYLPPLTPGAFPLENLARTVIPASSDVEPWIRQQIELFRKDHRHLARLLSASHAAPAVLVVDQFEEIFTRCNEDQERRIFVSNLLALTMVREIRHTVILTMRSDFVARVALIPELKEPFDAARMMITTLSVSELRDTIERPAALVGLKFEADVIDALVKEMLGEAAALPLLQFALLQLWHKRERNRVTMRAYRDLGGARRALGRSAELCYESLKDEDQQTARRILLKLVRPGDRMDATSQRIQLGNGVEATSSRIRYAELYTEGEDSARINDVLDKLIAAGLVRKTGSGSEAQVEVAHEAVIRNWQRLVNWLEAERQNLRWRVQLQETAGHWLKTGKDPSLLIRGSQLDEALQIKRRSKLETAFIAASLYEEQVAKFEAEQVAREREAARQHELELARERLLQEARQHELELTRERLLRAEAEHQRTKIERQKAEEGARAEIARERAEIAARQARVLRLLTAALAVALLLALAAIVSAFRSAAAAEDQRAQAITAQAQAQFERDKQATLAAERSAAEADAVAQRQSAEAARDSANVARQTAQADANALASEVALRQAQATIDTANAAALYSTSQAQAVAAQQVALAAQQTAEAQRDEAESAKNRAEAQTLVNRSWIEPLPGLRLSLAIEAARRDRSQPVEDALQAAIQIAITPIDHGTKIVSVAWSPDNQRVVTIADDKIARVWNIAIIPPRQIVTFSGHTDGLTSVAWSPDGRRIVTTSTDGTARVWDAATGNPLVVIRLTSLGVRMFSAAWNPKSQLIATTSSDQIIRVWEAATGKEQVRFQGGNDRLTWAAWSPDGNHFVTTSGRDAHIWDRTTGQQLLTLSGHTGTVRSAAWSPDGQHILTASDDGTARVWSTKDGNLIDMLSDSLSPLNSAMWSPSGRSVLLAGSNGKISVWNVDQVQQLAALPGGPATVNIALWSPDGTHVVIAGATNGKGVAHLYYVYFDDILLKAQSLPHPTLTEEQLSQALSGTLPIATPEPVSTSTLPLRNED